MAHHKRTKKYRAFNGPVVFISIKFNPFSSQLLRSYSFQCSEHQASSSLIANLAKPVKIDFQLLSIRQILRVSNI